MCLKKFHEQLDINQIIQKKQQQFQQNNVFKLLIKKTVGCVYNFLQDIILPSKISLLLSSRNQIVASIILDKIGISANIISIIILFL